MSGLYIDVSHGSLLKHGEELCGDKVELRRKEGDTFLVLADGLGSGVRANILASLTSKIVITMLSEGADIADIVDTMTATLPISPEHHVAYSTFTFLHINSAGLAHLVEFDNPDTVILRGGKAMDLPRDSYMVADKRIRETYVDLAPGDRCVMFSDGVICASPSLLMNMQWQYIYVVEFLERCCMRDCTANALQSDLLGACNHLYLEEPGDDTTVAVCHARLPNTACIMVGPPLDKDEDEALVRRFLTWKGTKVICGGTTSQIVSRVSGKKLTADTGNRSPKVPPTGQMEGVDLVTEGIITLRETLAILRGYEAGGIGRDNKLKNARDGASQLARLLLEQCTGVRFLVGRALNPAYQNPELPVDLNLKLQLVGDIAECLARMEKQVDIEYH